MEEFAVGMGSSITTDVTKGMFTTVKRHAGYILNRKLNLEDLKKKVEQLETEKEGVKHAVERAERNGEKIEEKVKTWLMSVDQKIKEVDQVSALKDRANDKCFIGLCPNLKSYYQLGKKAERDAKDVSELLEQGKFNDRVSYRPAVVEGIVALPNKAYQAFQSRAETVEGIMEALRDPNLTTVGVYGMAGVGKTMLVKEVGRKAREEYLFDEVVMATVSHNPNIRNIQGEIADMLGLKFDEETESGRAMRLRQRFQLSKDKKILVILDDIWGRLDLDSIGISFQDQDSEAMASNGTEGGTSINIMQMQNKVGVRSKILLTSRSQPVLHQMNTQTHFQVGVLSEEEAMDLFGKIMGETLDKPDFREVAVEVVAKCAGLPVAVSVIGYALKGTSLDTWNHALQQLRRSNYINIGDMEQGVYLTIELSYNFLKNKEAQWLFQLCALHPQGSDINVSYLQRYSLGLELLEDFDSIEDARKSANTAVEKLKASSLLLSNDNCIELVKMHDIIRDVSISIASKEKQMFVVMKEAQMKELLKRGKLNNCTAMSLPYGDFHELPDFLDCPNLNLFMLFNKDCPLTVPDTFFSKMSELKVLHLAGMHFPSLPQSFHCLTNLRTLCLLTCKLGDIAIIGNLNNLNSLSFEGSEIEQLPREMRQLTQLRLLDLSNCSKLKVIPADIISSLSCLEELYMGNSFDQWDVEGNASLAELKFLHRLTTLHVHILDPSIMPSGLFCEKLVRFKIFIGDTWDWSGKYEHLRTLKLKLNTSIDLDHGFRMVLKKTEDLYLDQLKGVNNVISQEIGLGKGFPYLKKLHVQNDPDVEYIIYDYGVANKFEFSELRSITLQDLPKLISFCLEEEGQFVSRQGEVDATLKSLPLFNHKIVFSCLENLRLSSINVERIWQNQLSNISGYTQNLTSLIIEGCENLRHLLSSSIARSLVNLKSLEIVKCKLLREIIHTEDIEEEENKVPISFPQLKSLEIKNLQHLVGFCSESYKIEFPSLKLLEIEGCPKMKGFIYKLSTVEENKCFSQEALFDEKVAFPSLEILIVSHLRNMKMIWNNQLSVNSFCKLQLMQVEHCDELLTIFPFDMLGTLQQLQTLIVGHCDSLEDIFELQGLNMKETQTMVDTQLREFYLYSLPALKNVWNKDPQGVLTFQNLSNVYIFYCWGLKNVFPASVARVLPQLKDLSLSSCEVEEIISKGDGSDSEANISFEFEQVSALTLHDLPKLKCLYPGMHTAKWPMLKKLVAYHCGQVNILDTVLKEDDNPESPTQPPFFLLEKVVPKLEEVSLNSDVIAVICENENKVSKHLFHEIKVLHLLCFHDFLTSFPTSFLERFNSLEVLHVRCSNFREVFSIINATEEINAAGIVLPIRKLILDGLCFLEHVWKQESRLDCILPNLEVLQVAECNRLISLGASSVPFQNLTTLDVWKCHRMVNLVPSTVAVQSLVQVKILKIRKCSALKEIVGNELATRSDIIVFERLKCLQLKHLPGLKSFCSGNHTFEFPLLDQVIVSHCPKLEFFCKGLLNAPMLQVIDFNSTNDKQGHWYGDLNSTIQQLHSKKVEYEGMKCLQLSKSSKYIEIWKDNLQPEANLDFKNLQWLEVCECNSLTYILTTSMALDLVKLRSIEVKNCPMMEQIIRNDSGSANDIEATLILPSLGIISLESCANLTCFYLGISNTVILDCPSLSTIVLEDCPKMYSFACACASPENIGSSPPLFSDKVTAFPMLSRLSIQGTGNWTKIWDDQLAVDSFPELDSLSVRNCGRLLHIIPFYMMEKLNKLEALLIGNCDSLEQVIGADNGPINSSESTAIPIFPKLGILQLTKLPKLKRFHSKNKIHTVDVFSQDPFPNLEMLWLPGNSILNEIWHGQLSTQLFCKLKALVVETVPNASVTILKCFIQALPNLEELVFIDSPLTEIFPYFEIDQVPAARPLARLRKLRLEGLHELKHLCKEEFPVAQAFNNLEKLKVIDCGKLHNYLVPSFVSFDSLTTLKVSKCHRLKHLITLPTVQSMVFLSKMTVTDCNRIEEIIAHAIGHDEVKDIIIFSKFKSLELGSLPSLSSFCSANVAFEFPSLETVAVTNCPKMKIFCKGDIISAPNVHKVQFAEDKERWDGNLNTTIERIFIERAPTLEDLELYLINFQRKWHYKLLASSCLAHNLTRLTVEGCYSLKCLFSSAMVGSFVHLKMLIIDNCENVESVLFIEGSSNEEEIMNRTLFHTLESHLLKDLPKLTTFCHGKYYLESALAKILRIENCPSFTDINSSRIL